MSSRTGRLPRQSRTVRAEERGAVLVEFALCLPVLVIILLGMIDLSQYAATMPVIRHGAAAGVRIAATTSYANLGYAPSGGWDAAPAALFDNSSQADVDDSTFAGLPPLNQALRFGYQRSGGAWTAPDVRIQDANGVVSIKVSYTLTTSSAFKITAPLVAVSSARREIQ